MKIVEAEYNMSLYSNKPSDYFSHARLEIEPLLQFSKHQACRALEVGCAGGHTLKWLKESGYCSWVAGVEPYASQNESTKFIDQFEQIDIQTQMPAIEDESLDLILCLDVLEHLIDPWETVNKLSKLLKPGGQWIVSIPNIRNYRILMDLVFKGRFEYQEAGILDRTHLRFFSRESLIQLIETTGAKVQSVISPEPQRLQKRLLSQIGLGDLLAKQFILSAQKNSGQKNANE